MATEAKMAYPCPPDSKSPGSKPPDGPTQCPSGLCEGLLDLADDARACRATFDVMLRKLNAVEVLAAATVSCQGGRGKTFGASHGYLSIPPSETFFASLEADLKSVGGETNGDASPALRSAAQQCSQGGVVAIPPHKGDLVIPPNEEPVAAEVGWELEQLAQEEQRGPTTKSAGPVQRGPTTKSAVSTQSMTKSFPWRLNDKWVCAQGISDAGFRNTALLESVSSFTGRLREEEGGHSVKTDQTERQALAPDSPLRTYWDMLCFVVFAAEVVFVPLQVFFHKEDTVERRLRWVQMIVGWNCMLYWIVSIPIGFISGYHTPDGELETRLRMAAKRYVRTWFLFDAVLVGSDLIFLVYDRPDGLASWGLRALRFLTFIRMIRVNGALEKTARRFPSSHRVIVVNLVKWFFVLLAVIHCVACGMYLLGIAYSRSSKNWISEFEISDRSFGYRYSTSAHWSLGQFAATKVEIRPTNTAERCFAVATGAVAVILNPWMVSKITTSLVGLQALNRSFSEKQDKLRSYLKKYNVSLEVRGRIWKTVSQQRSSDEHLHVGTVELLKGIPAQTLNALWLDLYRPVLTGFPFFRQWMHRCHDAEIAYELVSEVLGERFVERSQRLFNKGETAQNTFFVVFGLLNYVTASTSVERKLKKGNVLCQQALWFDWTHSGTATAVEDTDIFTINSAAFQRVFEEDVLARSFSARFHALALRDQNLDEVCDLELAEALAEYVFQDVLDLPGRTKEKGRHRQSRPALEHMQSFQAMFSDDPDAKQK